MVKTGVKTMRMCYFVKTSKGWYCRKMPNVVAAAGDLQPHIEKGELVVMTIDIKSFCDQMNVPEADITMWK